MQANKRNRIENELSDTQERMQELNKLMDTGFLRQFTLHTFAQNYESRQLDSSMIQMLNQSKQSSAQIVCPRCGSQELSTSAKQLTKSDEAQTVKRTCNNPICKHTWTERR